MLWPVERLTHAGEDTRAPTPLTAGTAHACRASSSPRPTALTVAIVVQAAILRGSARHALVAQRIERLSSEQKVRGSSPCERTRISSVHEGFGPVMLTGPFFVFTPPCQPTVRPSPHHLSRRQTLRWATVCPADSSEAKPGSAPRRSRPCVTVAQNCPRFHLTHHDAEW